MVRPDMMSRACTANTAHTRGGGVGWREREITREDERGGRSSLV